MGATNVIRSKKSSTARPLCPLSLLASMLCVYFCYLFFLSRSLTLFVDLFFFYCEKSFFVSLPMSVCASNTKKNVAVCFVGYYCCYLCNRDEDKLLFWNVKCHMVIYGIENFPPHHFFASFSISETKQKSMIFRWSYRQIAYVPSCFFVRLLLPSPPSSSAAFRLCLSHSLYLTDPKDDGFNVSSNKEPIIRPF